MFDDISLGAVGAALIAAIVSLVGLIISKEQKVSDFRQAWIDALRIEIVTYLTSINAIADAIAVPYKDQAEKVASLSPLYARLNQSHFAIMLRLNPSEHKSKVIIDCMNSFNALATDEAQMSAVAFKPLEIKFLHASKELLKYEWKRVKRGETTFVVTKWLAMSVVATFVILSIYYVGFHEPRVSAPPAIAVPTLAPAADPVPTSAPKPEARVAPAE